MRSKFIAGNWKMYKTCAQARAFAREFLTLIEKLPESGGEDAVRIAVAAPFTQLAALKDAFEGSRVAVAAQNMHFADEGAFTGEISADMLTEIGVEYCILGHSERRQYFGETNEIVNKKVLKALEKGICPILCVGESLQQRINADQYDLVFSQIAQGLKGVDPAQLPMVTIAYEPIWAIGTGKTATAAQAQEMCGFIRESLAELFGGETAEQMTVQYGGSVKPENAAELLSQPDIDGALVGGASLSAEKFFSIISY